MIISTTAYIYVYARIQYGYYVCFYLCMHLTFTMVIYYILFQLIFLCLKGCQERSLLVIRASLATLLISCLFIVFVPKCEQ